MKDKHTASPRRSSSSSGSQSVLRASLFGVASALICATACLIVFSIICFLASDPDTLFFPLGFCSGVLAFLCAGFFSARKRCEPLFAALISGIILTLILFLISLFIDRALSLGLSVPVNLLLRLVMIGICLIGALFGTNTGRKKPRRRR